MKKMVIGGAYVYSGKGCSNNTVRKIRDGGIVELGYSSWENDEQWIEVLENNFFIGFISSKTHFVDLRNYYYVIQNSLSCYEEPDSNSDIAICLNRFDKIYLISKVFNKGQIWIKIYDKHGFCCYIADNSCVCPNRFIPYKTTLAESTIMYISTTREGIYKPARLKKNTPISVNSLVAYRNNTGLDTSCNSTITDEELQLIFNGEDTNCLCEEGLLRSFFDRNFLSTLDENDDIWLEIYAYNLAGYIPTITKTNSTPYIDHLPTETYSTVSPFKDFINRNKLTIPGGICIATAIIMLFAVPSFPVSSIYLCVLGICLILLKSFCS